MEKTQTLTDNTLIDLYKQTGEEKYMAELYKRYAHLVYGSALNYFKDRAESQDMVAQIFIKLLKIIPKQNISSFSTFLFTVTRNECISKLRKMKSAANALDNFTEFEKKQDNFVENDASVRLDNESPDKEALVREAILELTPDQQRCVALFFFENKSYKEIVETTDYTLSQVKSHLQNGKRNLRNILETKI